MCYSPLGTLEGKLIYKFYSFMLNDQSRPIFKFMQRYFVARIVGPLGPVILQPDHGSCTTSCFHQNRSRFCWLPLSSKSKSPFGGLSWAPKSKSPCGGFPVGSKVEVCSAPTPELYSETLCNRSCYIIESYPGRRKTAVSLGKMVNKLVCNY